jgi:hypothetical protein
VFLAASLGTRCACQADAARAANSVETGNTVKLADYWCCYMSTAIVGTGSMATIPLLRRSSPWVFASSTQKQQSVVVDPKSPGSINSPHGLILFDGVCVLCSRGCGFVSKHGRRAYFRIVLDAAGRGRDWFRA